MLFKLLQIPEQGIASPRTQGTGRFSILMSSFFTSLFQRRGLKVLKKALKSRIKAFNSAQLPPWQGCEMPGDGNAAFLPLSCQSPMRELLSLQKYQIFHVDQKAGWENITLDLPFPPWQEQQGSFESSVTRTFYYYDYCY